MTIENTLERIAVALERLVAEKLPALTDPLPLPEVPPDGQPLAAAAIPEAQPKRRGRPPKTAEAAPAAAEPAAEAPPPAGPPAEVTKDDVRRALISYQAACGNDVSKARALLATHGGADVLANVPAERYAAVRQAALDATAKLTG